MIEEKMEEIYDVIIVGAGPAGSTAAFHLGEAGQRVLVLEKAILPRYKACGGGLSADLLKQFPFSFEDVIEAQVKSVSYSFGEKMLNVAIPAGEMLMVMRNRFDAHILKHSRVEVHQGEYVRAVSEFENRVVVETRSGVKFEAKYLIGADGANSIVAREVGLRRKKTLAAAIGAEVPVSAKTMQRFGQAPIFIFGEMRVGYLWIFPKAEHLSVGIGALHPKRGELQATLSRIMSRFGISLQGIKLHVHPIPIYLGKEVITTKRTLLVGDAAGLVDPFSGEGIRFGVKSGHWAARAILKKQPKSYQKIVDRRIGWSHTLGIGLARTFYRFPRICFRLGVHNPFVTYAFLDLISDRAGYGKVIIRIFGTLPLYLITELLTRLAMRVGLPEISQKIRKQVYPSQGKLTELEIV